MTADGEMTISACPRCGGRLGYEYHDPGYTLWAGPWGQYPEAVDNMHYPSQVRPKTRKCVECGALIPADLAEGKLADGR